MIAERIGGMLHRPAARLGRPDRFISARSWQTGRSKSARYRGSSAGRREIGDDLANHRGEFEAVPGTGRSDDPRAVAGGRSMLKCRSGVMVCDE
jgi:hypothetical protein